MSTNRTHETLRRISDEAGFRHGRNWYGVDPFHAWRSIEPGTGGVYAYFWNGRPIYVGQSSNIRARLRSYKVRVRRDERGLYAVTPWGEFKPRGSGGLGLWLRASSRAGDWLMHEQRLIRRLRPTYNRSVF